MHRRIEIDCALSSMTPKAVPAAPWGLLATHCHADADVEAAAAIVAPTNIAMRKRLMIALPMFMHARSSAPPRCSMLANRRSTRRSRARDPGTVAIPLLLVPTVPARS
jgi:hypothetical protein